MSKTYYKFVTYSTHGMVVKVSGCELGKTPLTMSFAPSGPAAALLAGLQSAARCGRSGGKVATSAHESDLPGHLAEPRQGERARLESRRPL